MIAVYPFDEEELCYATAGYSLWYDASSSANLCDGAYTGVTVWLDGTTLANSTQIFSDAECTCATSGWYMDPVDTTTYYYLDDRTCNLTPGTCAAAGPPADPCNVATNLVVENEYTVDYIYPSSSGPASGGIGGEIGG